MTFTITRAECDWLVALIAYRFFVADGLRVQQAAQRRFGSARLAHEFGDEMRLLADLGWFDGELLEALEMPIPALQKEYEVTLLSAGDLSATLGRLREDALAAAAFYRNSIADLPNDERQEHQAAYQLAAVICGDVLARLEDEKEQSQ